MTSLDFSNAYIIPLYFTLLINHKLNKQVNREIFLSLVILNTPFLNRLVIFLQYNIANYSSCGIIIGVGILLLF